MVNPSRFKSRENTVCEGYVLIFILAGTNQEIPEAFDLWLTVVPPAFENCTILHLLRHLALTRAVDIN